MSDSPWPWAGVSATRGGGWTGPDPIRAPPPRTPAGRGEPSLRVVEESDLRRARDGPDEVEVGPEGDQSELPPESVDPRPVLQREDHGPALVVLPDLAAESLAATGRDLEAVEEEGEVLRIDATRPHVLLDRGQRCRHQRQVPAVLDDEERRAGRLPAEAGRVDP